jgi:hypothetical protein
MPSLADLLHALLSIVWVTSGAVLSDGSALTAVAIVVAALIVIAAAVMSGMRSPSDAPVHPRRSIDVSSPLTQSDPDASGHPRPRAPGSRGRLLDAAA